MTNYSVKRIDELGRIVIPKNIRSQLKISDGETLNIYASNDSIVIKKNQCLNNQIIEIKKMLEQFEDSFEIDVLVVYKNEVLVATSKYQKLAGVKLEDSEINDFKSSSKVDRTLNEIKLAGFITVESLISNYGITGQVMLLSKDNDIPKRLAVFISKLCSSILDYS